METWYLDMSLQCKWYLDMELVLAKKFDMTIYDMHTGVDEWYEVH